MAVLATLATLWLSKTFARREDLSKVENKMADVSSRVSILEDKVESMPTQDEVNALRLDMAEMRGISRHCVRLCNRSTTWLGCCSNSV